VIIGVDRGEGRDCHGSNLSNPNGPEDLFASSVIGFSTVSALPWIQLVEIAMVSLL
jgi:hypothetical protein